MIARGNDLDLGLLPGRNARLGFSRTERDKHLYICGGTGTGKSKFLEHLIRQYILSWRKSRCGLLVLDPHGNLYDGLMRWLAWHRIDRPIVPIDLRQDDWVISYNLLRQRTADPAVLVDNITDAMRASCGRRHRERLDPDRPIFRLNSTCESPLAENNAKYSAFFSALQRRRCHLAAPRPDVEDAGSVIADRRIPRDTRFVARHFISSPAPCLHVPVRHLHTTDEGDEWLKFHIIGHRRLAG